MTKKPRHKPLRFLVTGALLIGPAIQACDEPQPVSVEAPVPNLMEDPPPPPEETAPDPGVEAPESPTEMDAPPAIGMGTGEITGTNVGAPTPMDGPQ